MEGAATRAPAPAFCEDAQGAKTARTKGTPCRREAGTPSIIPVKPSFVTWQLRRLHSEIDAIDKQRGDVLAPTNAGTATSGRNRDRDWYARRALLNRMLRSLPKRLGFRDAQAFIRAFERANDTEFPSTRRRHRLTATQIRELERRVLQNEYPCMIARAIGCAEQTVMNRASQLRKRLASYAEFEGGGI